MIELLTAFWDTEVGIDTKLHSTSTVEKCYLHGTLATNHLFSQVDFLEKKVISSYFFALIWRKIHEHYVVTLKV